MAWFNFWNKSAPVEDLEEKLNPVQSYYAGTTYPTRESTTSYEQAYEKLEIVNRGVNMIVDDCSEISFKIGPKTSFEAVAKRTYARASRVDLLLNSQPNPFQDISSFRRLLFTDYLLDGNIFIYFDGVHMYHLPASKVTIVADKKKYVSEYKFNGDPAINFKPEEIIHIKENSFYSQFRGVSRLKPAYRTMVLLDSMRDFQDNFFENGAVPGLVITSPNTLSQKIKDRMKISWQKEYNPKSGASRPMILDGGLALDSVSKVNFKELDFQPSIEANEKVILKAMGIPPILLDSGNNANIRPNMRLYYLQTVLPIVHKLTAAYTRYFGFEIYEDHSDIPALQPELRDAAQYYTSLVNAGIITPNEARVAMNFDEIAGCEEIRIPQNIAGSAVDPTQGGRPAEGDLSNGGEAETSESDSE